jgi:hypothetical protein
MKLYHVKQSDFAHFVLENYIFNVYLLQRQNKETYKEVKICIYFVVPVI